MLAVEEGNEKGRRGWDGDFGRENKDSVSSDDLKQESRQIAQRRRSQSAFVSNFLIHISSRPRPP